MNLTFSNVSLSDQRVYKVYTALLTQQGTSTPVPIVLENTLGEPVWSRSSAGVYSITLAGAFTVGKTFVKAPTVVIDPFSGAKNITIQMSEDIITFNLDGNELSDGWFGAAIGNFSNQYPIEIWVYN